MIGTLSILEIMHIHQLAQTGLSQTSYKPIIFFCYESIFLFENTSQAFNGFPVPVLPDGRFDGSDEVLWCADNSTLYFVQRENNTANPGKWGSLNVDRLAVAQNVDNSGTYKPVWLEIVRPNVKRVVFDSSFANAAPFSTAYWFYDMVNLEEINGLSYLNTSRATTMRCMFHGCSSLRGIDMSKFDTSNVTDMFGMFFNTSKVTSLNLSKFNTSKVTDMGSMFSNIAATSLDLSTFDTRNVTGMDGMFANSGEPVWTCRISTHLKWLR